MIGFEKRTRHGARWDETADEELRRRFAEGQLLPEVAKAMNRSQEAVRTRANVLHVPVRSTRRGKGSSGGAGI
jgi:hypothetical protein